MKIIKQYKYYFILLANYLFIFYIYSFILQYLLKYTYNELKKIIFKADFQRLFSYHELQFEQHFFNFWFFIYYIHAKELFARILLPHPYFILILKCNIIALYWNKQGFRDFSFLYPYFQPFFHSLKKIYEDFTEDITNDITKTFTVLKYFYLHYYVGIKYLCWH